jgi:Flp pilus assembly protein TadD
VLVAESRALVALGRPRDAVRALAPAAQQPNPPADLLVELARTQMLAGDHGAARQTAAAVRAQNPGHPACLALEQELGRSLPTVARASAIGTTPR